MTMDEGLETLLALELLGELDEDGRRELARLEAASESDAAQLRRELERGVELLAIGLEPVEPPPRLRTRLLDQLGGRERLSPFAGRLAELFDLTVDAAREVLTRFDVADRWTPMFPGAAYLDVEAGPGLADAHAGLVRVGPGLDFPHHRHLGREIVLVLQGEFETDDGQRVGPGQRATMTDGSAHAFRVVSEQELLYAVVVGQVEFADGTRAP